MIVCVGDPDEVKDRFGAYLGRDTQTVGVTTDRGRVYIAAVDDVGDFLPDFFPPRLPDIAAVTVMTTDLGEARRVIRNNGIKPVTQRDGILWIAPTDALGCYLGFHEHKSVCMDKLS